MVKKIISYGNSSPQTIVTAPAHSVVSMAACYVDTTFNGSVPSFILGDASDDNGFITDIGAQLGTTGYKNTDHDEWGNYLWHNAGSHPRWKFYEVETPVVATFNFDSSTQGQLTVFVCMKMA